VKSIRELMLTNAQNDLSRSAKRQKSGSVASKAAK
jgi:hypothetical protein